MPPWFSAIWRQSTKPMPLIPVAEAEMRVVGDPSTVYLLSSTQEARIGDFLIAPDTEVAGCPIQAGQMVYLPLVSANRDPREFDERHPEEGEVSREQQRRCRQRP